MIIRKLIQLVFLSTLPALFCSISANAQQQWNLPLLANWDDDSIPPAWTGAFSECWGYAAPDGKEYAFLASTQGTYFFNVTEPTTPVLIDFIKTRDTTVLVVNKDYATYSHYLYAVSDQGNNSLQIFDLQYLPDSVVKVYDENTISKRCHTLCVDNNRLYMASNTRPDNSFGPMDIFSLADPLNPVLLGTVSHPDFFSVHEAFVKNDTAYCSNGNNGLWIYDVEFPATPSLISIVDTYSESGYNHSSWLTDDSKTMVFTDENHGLGVKIFDMTDIHDPQLVSIIRSNLLQEPDSLSSKGSVAHNPYIVGNILLLSYYHDGVQAYDISNPSHPELIGFHDTHPQDTSYYSYTGCWGLYPFLPSGNIIASDITNGLFILDGKKILNHNPPSPQFYPSVSLGANPVIDDLEIFLSCNQNTKVDITVHDMTGRIVHKSNYEKSEGSGSIRIPLQNLSSGIYVATVNSEAFNLTSKFIKIQK